MWCSSLSERNSSIKQLFKFPVGSSTGCKIYEQQYKQTVDGSKRVPEAAGRESLAITTQSITFSARHIQPQALQQCIQNIFPHSHDRSSVITSHCGSSWFHYKRVHTACNVSMLISIYLQCLCGIYSRAVYYLIMHLVWQPITAVYFAFWLFEYSNAGFSFISLYYSRPPEASEKIGFKSGIFFIWASIKVQVLKKNKK